jgi:hypothetical protein
LAGACYQPLSDLMPQARARFPPDRFHFEVLDIGN